MGDSCFELEDYRKVWDVGTVIYRCCNYQAVATFHKNSEFLECPKCGIMTEFIKGIEKEE